MMSKPLVKAVWRTLRRTLAWLFLGLVALLLFLGLVTKLLLLRVDLHEVEAELSKASLLTAQVGGIGSDWKGMVVLTDVRLTLHGQPVVETPRAGLRIAIWDLLARRPDLLFLRLDQPVVHLTSPVVKAFAESLHQNPDLTRNLRIALHGGTIEMDLESGTKVRLHQVTGTLAVRPEGIPLQLTFSDDANGHYSLQGTAGAQGLDFKGDLQGVSLNEAFGLMGKSPGALADAVVDGPMTLSGDFSGASMSGNWHIRSRAIECQAACSLRLAMGPQGFTLHGEVTSDKGTLPLLGTYRSLSCSFKSEPGALDVQHGDVVLPAGIVSLTGTIGGDGSVNLHVGSSAFTVSAAGIPGSIDGSLTGAYPALHLGLSGQIPAWRMGATELHDVRFSLQGTQNSPTSARLDSLQVGSGLRTVRLDGAATWNDRGDADLQIPHLDAASILGPEVPASFVGSVTLHYDRRLQQWSGRLRVPQGTLAQQAFEQLSADFAYTSSGHSTVTAQVQALGTTATLQGDLSSDGAVATISAHSLPLEKLPIMAGLQGPADVQARWNSGAPQQLDLRFSSTHLTWNGRGFLPISGTAQVAGEVVHLKLEVPDIVPGLDIAGDVSPSKGWIDLQTELRGQDAGSVTELLSPSLPAIHGNIYGTLRVQGLLDSPTVRFSGEMTHGGFGDMSFETSHLTLSRSTPQNVDMDLEAESVPLLQVAQIQGVLPGLAGMGKIHIVSRGSEHALQIGLSYPSTVYRGHSLGPLTGDVYEDAGITYFRQVTLPLTVPGLVVSGHMDRGGGLDLHGSCKGQDLSGLAAVAPGTWPALQGQLFGTFRIQGRTAQPAISFEGQARGLYLGDLSLGDAAIRGAATTADQRLRVQVSAEIADASRVSLLQKALPGVAGSLSLQTTLGDATRPAMGFHLDRASWHQRALPGMSGTLSWDGPKARVDELALEGPGAVLRGQAILDPETGALEFTAQLQDSSLEPWMAYLHDQPLWQRHALASRHAGTEVGPAVDARLSGRLSITRQGLESRLQFAGTAQDFRLGNVLLGPGQVEAAASTGAPPSAPIVFSAHGQKSGTDWVARTSPRPSGGLHVELRVPSSSPAPTTFDLSTYPPR